MAPVAHDQDFHRDGMTRVRVPAQGVSLGVAQWDRAPSFSRTTPAGSRIRFHGLRPRGRFR